MEMGLEPPLSAMRGRGEAGRAQSIHRAHGLPGVPRFAFLQKNVRKEEKERKKRTSHTSQPELPPRGWSQGFLCWRKPRTQRCPQPGRGQDPRQPLRGGRCPSPSPGPGTGEGGQDGHGSSSHSLQPLTLRTQKGLLLGCPAQRLGLTLSPAQPFPPPPACAQAPRVILGPASTSLPTHMRYWGPVCTHMASSGISPVSSLFFQTRV